VIATTAIPCDYNPADRALWYVATTDPAPVLVRSRFVCQRHRTQAEAVVGDGGRAVTVSAINDSWRHRMTDVDTEMRDMVDRFNRTKIAELEATTGLRWLGDDGPVYRSGPHAIKALFVGPDGTHWGDTEMVIESVWPGPLNADARVALSEMFSGGSSPLHELNIWATWRGQHTAYIVPITDICGVLDLDAPQMSTDSWARMWGTLPGCSDGHERQLVALGAPELVAGKW
jgi:hypothetical protein